jgi:sec-independent protein translocase protein TatA
MDFLGIGSPELILVLVVALVIFGPGRLVEMSRELGKVLRTLSRSTGEIRERLNREVEELKLKDALPDLKDLEKPEDKG